MKILVLSYLRELSRFKKPFLFSSVLFIGSLLFNTSFHIMGVDIGKELAGIFQVGYLFSLLWINSKLFLILFSLSVFIFLVYDFFRDAIPTTRDLYYVYASIFFLLQLFYSICYHPQLYGEFFYIRYPSLTGLLYFLTENLAPAMFAILTGFLFAPALYKFVIIVWKKEEASYQELFSFFLLFLSSHIYGNFVLLSLSVFFYPLQISIQTSLKRKAFFFVLILSFALPLYHDGLPRINSMIGKQAKTPSLFIIAADSLRHDRLSAYGGKPVIAPALNEFSRDSGVFLDHHVTIPRTFPSWADTLTGEYSMAHKVRGMFPSPQERNAIGSAKFPTLPQYLKKQGFKTGVFSGFAGDIFPRAEWGFTEKRTPNFNADVILITRSIESQLFLLPILSGAFLGGGAYIPEMEAFPSLGDGRRRLKEFGNFLRKNAGDPVFALFFDSVAHFPYSPPYPYYKKFTTNKYRGPYKYLKFVDPKKEDHPSEADKEEVRKLFDSSIYAFDRTFLEITNLLKSQGLYENSIIIVTSDHGEALFEDIHGHGHGEHLRGENITKVPFLIRFPGALNKSFVFKGMTSSIDLLPTILDFYKIDAKKKLPGRSLINSSMKGNWDDDRGVYAETGIWFSDKGSHFFQKQRILYPDILRLHRVVPESGNEIMITDPFFRETIAFAKHRSLITSRYKYIYIPTHDGVVHELYDRKLDPLNRQNIYSQVQSGSRLKDELYGLVIRHEGAKNAGGYLLPPPPIN